jgi:hypothetical protein
LFEHNATDYTNHGIGDLMGCSECKARQTSEGEIELSFTYPCTDYLFPELQIGRQVLAKIDDDKPAQIFRIYGIEENIDAKVTVNCQHISYDLSGYPVKKFGNQISPDQVISKVTEKTGTDYNNLVLIGTDTAFPFTMSAYSIPQYDQTKTYERGEYVINGRPDKPEENDAWQCIEAVTTPEEFNADHWNLMEKFKMEAPKTVRELLLDGDDSILGLYGGDIVFNNRDVQIKKTAGEDRGVVIEYGVDLMEFSQDKNISEMVTGVLPYWKGNVRGTTTPKSTYEVYNGSKFEKGYTYFTREPNYISTQDPEINISKTYYVLDSQTHKYRSAEMRDFDFKSNVIYYEAEASSYERTTDTGPLPGEIYYIYEDSKYRESVPSDLKFRSGVTYYELINGSYTEVQSGTIYDWTKTYYIKTETEHSELVMYDEVTSDKLTFTSGVTYYELINDQYVVTQDDKYYPNKDYYIENNVWDYVQATTSDLDFKSGITYYENNGEQFVPTEDEHYDPTKMYFKKDQSGAYTWVTNADLDFAAGNVYCLLNGTEYVVVDHYDSNNPITSYYRRIRKEYDYTQATTADLDFNDSLKPYHENVYENINGEYRLINEGDHYDSTKLYFKKDANDMYVWITNSDLDFISGNMYCLWNGISYTDVEHYDANNVITSYYRKTEIPQYRLVTMSDLDFIESLKPYYERVLADYVVTSDEHYKGTKTYYLKREEGGESTIVYAKVNSYDLDFLSGLLVYKRAISKYSQTQDTSYQPSKTYYLPSTRLGSFIPVGITDLAFKSPPAFYYYEQSGYRYIQVPEGSTFDETKVYYVSDTIEDKEIYVYAPIQYADGFAGKPASLQKIENLDLSEYFNAETETEKPSEADLIARAKRWMLTNEVGIPAIDLTVQYAKLGQDVRLYDAITVRFPKLGIETKAKVTSYTYDVLKERCTEIQVSNAKAASAWSSLEDASRLRKGVLSPSRIGKKSITSDHIGSGEITSSNIASGGVSGVNIEPEAVTEPKLAKDSVTYQKIVDGTIITEKIKDGAVTGTKVLDQAISVKKLDKELQIFYSDIVSALQIFSDRATINRYVDSAGYYGDIYLISVDGADYSMSLHTHQFKESASGNGYIEMEQGVDWTGGSHPFDMRSTRFYKSEVRRMTIDHWKGTSSINPTKAEVRVNVVVYNADDEILGTHIFVTDISSVRRKYKITNNRGSGDNIEYFVKEYDWTGTQVLDSGSWRKYDTLFW